MPAVVRDAPAGAPASRLKDSVFAGASGSVAVAVNDSNAPSSTILSPIAASTGAWLTSFTVIMMASKSDSAGVPSSVTRTVTGYGPGPCASVGVQVKTPAVVMDAPAGAPASRP